LSDRPYPFPPPPYPPQIGGGIRGYTDATGRAWSALDVAARYFRAGADKVSIGSDAVAAAEAYYARGRVCDGSTAIEQIAGVYGRQAVVVSIDPRRVYVADPAEATAAGRHVIPTARPGPAGERWVWYQCLVKGGREGRPLDARALAVAVEALGAGELLVNCVDADGQKGGFDEELLADVCAAVRVPVIASSGAGCAAHFTSVFGATRVEAALAAGIFHRREVPIGEVKAHMAACGVEARMQA
jgi:glutamine amidotransferase/cyclase